jgi:hypothetical protein
MRQNQSIRGIISPARLSVSARHYLGSTGSLSALDRLPITGSISALISPARLGSHESILSGFLADSRHYSGFSMPTYTKRHYRILHGFKAILWDCALFQYIVALLSYCIYPVILYKNTVILGQKMAFFSCVRSDPPSPKFLHPYFFKGVFVGFSLSKKWICTLSLARCRKVT